MGRKKIVKKQSEFIISLLFLGLGLFLATNKSITGEALNALGGFWAQPSTYIRVLGWGQVIFSTILLLWSLNWSKSDEVEKVKLNIGFEAAVTAGLLVVYCVTLPIITFFPATFLLVLCTNLLYKRKENQMFIASDDTTDAEKATNADKQTFNKKSVMISVVYALCITLAAWVAFTKLLKAVLP